MSNLQNLIIGICCLIINLIIAIKDYKEYKILIWFNVIIGSINVIIGVV